MNENIYQYKVTQSETWLKHILERPCNRNHSMQTPVTAVFILKLQPQVLGIRIILQLQTPIQNDSHSYIKFQHFVFVHAAIFKSSAMSAKA